MLSWFAGTDADGRGRVSSFREIPADGCTCTSPSATGGKVSAYSASDGTLRFLGILAALLNDDAGGIYFFEEIDATASIPTASGYCWISSNSRTAKGKIQVITTTHNPALLAWMNDDHV